MKKIVVLLLMAVATHATAQTTEYIVSMSGIGPLRIGMTKADIEKILAKKIALHYLSPKDSGYADTIKTKYKSIDLILYLGKQYFDEDKEEIVLTGIRSGSALCKTRTGIGIGDDKIKVVTTYENYTLYIWPDWEDDTYTKRSKSRSVINVSSDDSQNTIVFHLVNKKVVAFEVMYYEGE
ncbi:MAG: hypothetical protein ABI688_05785 [Bacteroidota bacterium]